MVRNPFQGMRLTHLDSGQTAFFARQLEHIVAEAFVAKTAPIDFRKFIPLDTAVDPGARLYTYRMYEHVGQAKRIKDYAADSPTANAVGTEYSRKIEDYGSSFIYSLNDVRAAAKTGMDLPREQAFAARRAIDAQLDEVAAFGDKEVGTLGLLNLTHTTPHTVKADGSGGSKKWSSKSPDKILRDLREIVSAVVDGTNTVELPDTVLLPPAQYDLIAGTPRSEGSDKTILQFFLETSPYIRNVDQWHRLKGAGEGGVDRMVCYRRDPSAVRLVLPIQFEALPPQEVNYAFKVPCQATCGGVVSPYPKSIAYGDGI